MRGRSSRGVGRSRSSVALPVLPSVRRRRPKLPYKKYVVFGAGRPRGEAVPRRHTTPVPSLRSRETQVQDRPILFRPAFVSTTALGSVVVRGTALVFDTDVRSSVTRVPPGVSRSGWCTVGSAVRRSVSDPLGPRPRPEELGRSRSVPTCSYLSLPVLTCSCLSLLVPARPYLSLPGVSRLDRVVVRVWVGLTPVSGHEVDRLGTGVVVG